MRTPILTCITLYIEGFHDGRRFIDACQQARKPIIALKSGVSAHGAAAAASHTGSLAGATKVYGAAFKQAGVLQATDLNDLFNRTLVLSLQPPMEGDNLLVLTNGGGVGVLATDSAEKFGVPLKFAPAELQAEMKKHMPEFGSAKNPVDLTGMAGNDWYFESVRYALSDKWVDGLVVLYCETAITVPMDIAQSIKRAVDAADQRKNPSPFPSSVGSVQMLPLPGWSKTAFLHTTRPIWRSVPWLPCVNSPKCIQMVRLPNSYPMKKPARHLWKSSQRLARTDAIR